MPLYHRDGDGLVFSFSFVERRAQATLYEFAFLRKKQKRVFPQDVRYSSSPHLKLRQRSHLK